MSRSNYGDDDGDCDYNNGAWLWHQAVLNAINGRRGQSTLRELLAALDAMPVKELITEDLACAGQYCTLGVLGHAKGLDEKMAETDPAEAAEVAGLFKQSEAFVREVMYMNDEAGAHNETPSQRWGRMREWVRSQIHAEA